MPGEGASRGCQGAHPVSRRSRPDVAARWPCSSLAICCVMYCVQRVGLRHRRVERRVLRLQPRLDARRAGRCSASWSFWLAVELLAQRLRLARRQRAVGARAASRSNVRELLRESVVRAASARSRLANSFFSSGRLPSALVELGVVDLQRAVGLQLEPEPATASKTRSSAADCALIMLRNWRCSETAVLSPCSDAARSWWCGRIWCRRRAASPGCCRRSTKACDLGLRSLAVSLRHVNRAPGAVVTLPRLSVMPSSTFVSVLLGRAHAQCR